jgi:hypothetical protein
MSVGNHFAQADWNQQAYNLFQLWQNFSDLATRLSGFVAAVSDTQLEALGFSVQDVSDLRGGLNVAATLVALGNVNGTPQQAQANTASQCQVALAKFGGG